MVRIARICLLRSRVRRGKDVPERRKQSRARNFHRSAHKFVDTAIAGRNDV